jgi:RNA polymerase sigma factor (sigma-70 family)
LDERSEASERRLQQALEELSPALWAWISLRVGPALRPVVEPEDVFQEVWCRAFMRIGEFDRELPFRPWLFGIAQNVLREVLREVGRRRIERWTPSASGGTHPLDRIADTVSSVTRRMMREEALRRFLDGLATLDDEERRLLILHGLEGVSLVALAEHFALSHETLKKRWQRLRRRLEEQGLPEHLLVA